MIGGRVLQERRGRRAAVIVAFALYVALFLGFRGVWDYGLGFFGLIPLVVVAGAYGFWPGLLMGIAAHPMNVLLRLLAGEEMGPHLVEIGRLAAWGSGVVVGGAIGYLRDVIVRCNRAMRDLAKANEALDAFSHTVAHELKGPLTVCVGYSEAIALGYQDTLSEEIIEHLEQIAEEGRRMSRIIDDLMLLAHLHMEEVDLCEVNMEAAVAIALGQLDHLVRKYEAEILLPEEFPPVVGYEPWVEQVWVNFVENAIRFGGDPPRVTIGCQTRQDGVVRYSVGDNGPGLTDEQKAELLAPLPADGFSIELEDEGKGLSIVRRIVDKLGGQVEVESEVGGGSVFSFTLPAA